MIHEFWDVRSNNLEDAVSTEAEARAMLRRAIEDQDERVVEWLMLIEDDPDSDSFRRIGIGSELLACVRDVA